MVAPWIKRRRQRERDAAAAGAAPPAVAPEPVVEVAEANVAPAVKSTPKKRKSFKKSEK